MPLAKQLMMFAALCTAGFTGCISEEPEVKGEAVEREAELVPVLVPEVEPEMLPESGSFAIPVNIPEEYLEKAQEYYKKAVESGEQVPKGVKEWVQRDISSIGTWEYRVLDSAEGDPEKLAEELNALGGERWECFWVEATPEGKRFYFKKAKWSYLRNASGLVRMIPMPGGGGN